MHEKFNKMMEKKKDGQEIDPMYKHAKMSMLQALKDEMSGMMKDDISHPMKKVEVAADDKAGLVKGLDKAKDLLGAVDEHSEDEMDMPEEEGIENDSLLSKAYGEMGLDHEDAPEEAMPEDDAMSDDEMEQLQMLLDKMKKSKMAKKF